MSRFWGREQLAYVTSNYICYCLPSLCQLRLRITLSVLSQVFSISWYSFRRSGLDSLFVYFLKVNKQIVGCYCEHKNAAKRNALTLHEKLLKTGDTGKRSRPPSEGIIYVRLHERTLPAKWAPKLPFFILKFRPAALDKPSIPLLLFWFPESFYGSINSVSFKTTEP